MTKSKRAVELAIASQDSTSQKGGKNNKKKKKPREPARDELLKTFTKAMAEIPDSWENLVYSNTTCRDARGKRKIQKVLSHALQCSDQLWMYVNERSDIVKAKMVSQYQPGAVDWLKTVPFQVGLRIKDAPMRWNLRHWLVTEKALEEAKVVWENCPKAKAALDPKGKMWQDLSHGQKLAALQHIVNCKLGGMLIYRHNQVLYALSAMLRDAGVNHLLEARAMDFEQGNGGPDLFVEERIEGKGRAVVELTTANSLNKDAVKHSSKIPRHMANLRVKSKNNKYEKLAHDHLMEMIAVAVEVTGGMSNTMLSFINECGEAAKLHTSSSTYETCRKYWSAPSFNQYCTGANVFPWSCGNPVST